MSVSLTHSHHRLYVPVNGIESNYLLFEMKGNSLQQLERSPINLSIVLDRSGSMTGEPLHFCKEAIKFVINQLTEKDVLSVVVFDDQVKTVFGPEKVIHKDSLKGKIDQIETGGMTNLSGGLIQGCQHVLKKNSKQFVNRVIILSDGNANSGITEFGHFMKVVDDYQTGGVIISSIGVSDHFDEELMEGIAEHGKGNFYFIDKVEEIPTIFSKELDGLLSTVAQNITFTIMPKNGVQIKSIYGYQYKRSEGEFSLSLGDLFSNEVKSILVEYSSQTYSEGLSDVFDIKWAFVDVTEGAKDCFFELKIPLHFTTDLNLLSEQPNLYVEKQVQITKAAASIEEAMKFFDSGDMESGKTLLHNQAVNMASIAEKISDPELMSESVMLMNKINNFEYSKKTRKELHHQKYRQMKRKKE